VYLSVQEDNPRVVARYLGLAAHLARGESVLLRRRAIKRTIDRVLPREQRHKTSIASLIRDTGRRRIRLRRLFVSVHAHKKR
jgi:hypothetical protein